MIRFVVPGEPMPKERVQRRFEQYRSFMPTETRKAELTVQQHAALAAVYAKREGGIYPQPGYFWLGASFYLGTTRSKHGKVLYRNADLDNLVKLVQDAMKGVFWIDDKQVRGYLPGTKKVLGYPYPQTIVVLAHEDELSKLQLASYGELPT